MSPRSVHQLPAWLWSGMLILGVLPSHGAVVGDTKVLSSPELWGI